MVVVKLYGGLGNQMFQYAFGRQLATERHSHLWLDLSELQSFDVPGRTRRYYALGEFSIRARILPNGIARALERNAKQNPNGLIGQLVGFTHCAEDAVHLDICNKRNVYLDGYWQSEKYFKRIRNVIETDFRLRTELDPARATLLKLIKNDISASVHVRRGDYVTNPTAAAYHGTLSPEWYAAAGEALAERLGRHPNYFIFSDDLRWCQENIKLKGNVSFVDVPADGRDAADLMLMSACDHHVIANSSYSWWGAWLNCSRSKQVVAPKRWFADRETGNDRLPMEWVQV